MGLDDADDDVPQLSADTLAALQQFYGERDNNQERFEKLKAQAEDDFASKPLSMEAFAEDWNASQFWYSDSTATTLAKALLADATSDTRVVVVSAPSVFVQLKNILTAQQQASEQDGVPRPSLTLLEYDDRFGVFPEFVPYDFAHPTKLPPSLKGSFDRIICDPPFLSEDCQTKAALTARWLAKPDAKIIVCTGERMEELVSRLYGKLGVRTTAFEVEHAKGLSNEFRCYANFDGGWGWREQ